MAQVDQTLKILYQDILDHGEIRDTRTGKVHSRWNYSLEFNLQKGFPAVTSKKLAWNPVVGELLWFLSGSYWLQDLKHYTFNDETSDKWTIWTDDTERWGSTNYVGYLYPHQWRNFGSTDVSKIGTDQIQNLIKNLKEQPARRDHIVMAWNAFDIEQNDMALKPCHLGFQCYVTEKGHLNLHWFQRSVDSFLGLPFNIASYALLTHLLAQWAGLKPGKLSCWLGDTHIYDNHCNAVKDYINNEEFSECQLSLPEGTDTLEDTLTNMTAVDFKNSLVGYQSAGVIKAPLSVGK